MDQAQWEIVKHVFLQVVDVDRESQEDLIQSLCEGDGACMDEVKALLRGADNTLLTKGELAEFHDSRIQDIGPFEVLREIGRGGMGRVFEVRRKDADFEQKLALKLVHPTLSGEMIEHRFNLERRILAKLEHPNIARFIDGGISPLGPYYVMEFIDGQPITDYCDQNQLSIQERIDLFGQVCAAVQFSHQHFIVHRDIKPGNILVTADGTVKLLDFGIAKVLQGDGTNVFQKTVFQSYTRDDSPMTPVYASPEQYLNEPVTAASDVYSLGLVLYQLLTGRLAYDFDSKSLLEIDQLILREQPTKPSSRSQEKTDKGPSSEEIALNRHVTPEKLKSTLKGDLDAIVLMALRKDPADRYASVADLADDLTRYSQHLPVSASPPSAFYRTKMFVRRHRTGVTFGLILMLSIVGGSIGTLIGWSRAVEARNQAEQERARAVSEAEKTSEILDFLQSMLASASPREAGRDVKVVDVLDQSAAELNEKLKNRPEIEAGIRLTLGTTYNALGEFSAADEQLTRARDIWVRLGEEHSRSVLEVSMHRASSRHELGRYEQANALLRDNQQALEEVLGPEDPLTLNNKSKLAHTYKSLGKLKRAEELLRETVAAQERTLGEDHKATIDSIENLGNVISDQGRYDEAEALYKRVTALLSQKYGGDHPDLVENKINLQSIHYAQGKWALAEKEAKELLDVSGRVFGPHHVTTLTLIVNLTTILNDLKKHDEAFEIGRKYVPIMKREIGNDHVITMATINGVANSLSGLNRYQEAKHRQMELLGLVRQKFGTDHPEYIMVLCNLGISHYHLKEFDAAVKCHRQATQRSIEVLGEDHFYTLVSKFSLGKDLFKAGQIDEGKRMLEETRQRMIDVFGEDHPLSQQAADEMDALFPDP